MDVKIESSWIELLKEEFEQPYFEHLTNFVKREYSEYQTFPPAKLIFAAFEFCKLSELKVVILGQDPYHGLGQANGLCFSVNDGVKSPPSLANIFKEIFSDVKKPIPESGNLERWAKQGVLLLNATLTVRANNPGSHQNQGWEMFTDKVIEGISASKNEVVFLLWGAYAKKKAELIDQNKHLILMCPHPSPFSAHKGFLGNKHFSQTNLFLASKGKETIDW